MTAEPKGDELLALLAAAERDIARRELAADATHSEECWRWHLYCAVERVERLEAQLARARDALSDLVELMQVASDDLPEHIWDELTECERGEARAHGPSTRSPSARRS